MFKDFKGNDQDIAGRCRAKRRVDGRPGSGSSVAAGLAVAVGLALAACVPAGSSDQSASGSSQGPRVDSYLVSLAEAQACGAALGTAARCDFIGSQHDFAILRYHAQRPYAGSQFSAPQRQELVDTFDQAVIEQLYAVRSCEIPHAEVGRMEQMVREAVRQCSQGL